MSQTGPIIAGIISMLLALWFLGWMVVSINSLPLWIVISVTIGMLLYDFYQSMKQEQSNSGNGA